MTPADPNFFIMIGIKFSDIMAGLAGGIVNAFVFQRSNPVAIVGSMVVGALTANYLGEIAAKFTGTSEGAAAFIVGLCGMAVCQGIIEAGSRWKPAVLKGPVE